MELTLLGTGSPVPTTERAGTSLVVTLAGDPVLVDCGPLTVQRLLEANLDPGTIETLLFTHHHVDHNADFFRFLISSWSLGRESLDIYGPAGTEDFLEAAYDLYAEDIEYRTEFYPRSGIEDVTVTTTTPDLEVAGDGWTATAHPVEHSIETYAYRFDEPATGQSCVVSGDTRRIDSLGEFAAGADVLVQDCCIGPVTDDPPTEGWVVEPLTEPPSEELIAQHKQNHCDPEDCGEIAAAAGVDTLVLTHLLPYRDHAAMAERAGAVFDGEVVVAQDGMRLTP